MRPALPLDESTGDLARGVSLFLVLDRQGKEWESALRLADGYRGEHHGLAVLNDGCTSRLLCHPAGLDDETASCEIVFYALH